MMSSTIAKSNPQLIEDLERLPERGLRLVSSHLPKVIGAARQTGRAVKQSVSDLASSASDAIEALPAGDAFKATGLAVASTAALQATQRGLLRLATRRPMLFLLGGIAIVGGIALAVRRRRADGNAGPQAGDDIGEGSYAGSRDYHARTQAFLKAEGKQVTRRAKQARDALEGSERTELEAAEEEGRRRARS
jgi:hypothetical protein